MNVIYPVQTNVIRYADFMRLTTSAGTYLFSTAPYAITVPSISSTPFTGLSQLVKVGSVQRDIKSTANETQVTMVGIDTAMLGLVLGTGIKGSKIELWHGFFDANNQLITTPTTNSSWKNNSSSTVTWTNSSAATVNWVATLSNSGLYQYFNGIVNSFAISEQWMEEVRMFTGTITISASSIQLILQNRIAGRYTNDNSWQFFASGDTSMNRVNFISTINYMFGKKN